MRKKEISKESIIEAKIEWNLKRFFMPLYLLQVGFSKFLDGKGGVTSWRDLTPDDLGEHFLWVFQKEKPESYERLVQGMTRYFTNKPNEYVCNKKVYAMFVPFVKENRKEKGLTRILT